MGHLFLICRRLCLPAKPELHLKDRGRLFLICTEVPCGLARPCGGAPSDASEGRSSGSLGAGARPHPGLPQAASGPGRRATDLLLRKAVRGGRGRLQQLPEVKQMLSLLFFQITVEEKVCFWIFVAGHSIKKCKLSPGLSSTCLHSRTD